MSDCNKCENCTCENGHVDCLINVSFRVGEVSGRIDNCDAAEVADALVAVADELRRMDDTPTYIRYDEGKISVGNPLSNEEN